MAVKVDGNRSGVRRWFAVIARSSCDEAIHSSFAWRHGLLRFARNDAEGAYAFFGRIASGVSGCIDGCDLANSGSAIAVSKMRFTVG